MEIAARLMAGLLFFALHGILVLYALGYAVRDLARRPYLVFGLGAGGAALASFFLALCGLPMRPPFLWLTLLVWALPALVRFFLRSRAASPWRLFEGERRGATGPLGRWERLLCALFLLVIVIQVLCAFFTSTVVPEVSWDGRARWALKANILFEEGSLPTDYFSDPAFEKSHPYYPLLVPIEMAQIYFFLGEKNDSVVKILFALYVLMILWALFDFALERVGPTWALFFTALFATIPTLYIEEVPVPGLSVREGSVNTCMADIPLAFHSLLALILSLRGLMGARLPVLWALSLTLCCLAFTKSEGLYYALIYLIGFALISGFAAKKALSTFIVRLAWLAGLFVLLILPWMIFRALHIDCPHKNFPETITLSYFMEKVPRLGFIVPRLLHECCDFTRWHLIWPLFAAALFWSILKRRFSRDAVLALLVVLGFLCFHAGVYMLSSWWGDRGDEACRGLIDCTISRLFLPLIPAVLFFGLLAIPCKRGVSIDQPSSPSDL